MATQMAETDWATPWWEDVSHGSGRLTSRDRPPSAPA